MVIVPVTGALVDWVGGDLELYLALQGLTPSGSFKDFGMTVAITTALLAGVPFVICASTGDTSAAAAAYAAAAGIPCYVFLPKGKVSAAQLVQPLAYGAKIIEVNGDFDDCMRIVQELVEHHGAFPVNSLNPARIEGHQVTAFNSWLQLGHILPDWFVLPLGNGSNTSSVGKGQRTLRKWLLSHGEDVLTSRILAVQPENAAPLGNSFHAAGGWEEGSTSLALWRAQYQPVVAGDTIATAARIGKPVSYAKVMREIMCHGGGVTSVSDSAARQAMFAAGASGHMVCPQTGLALAGLRWAVETGQVKPRSRVVAVSTATGLKFSPDFEPPKGSPFATSLDSATTSEAAKIIGL